ncbi:MAG: hypothetical protein K8I03_07305 [Ignavibacteria bacterium]|nr:hypothetical protein [Ignavibacteria bacterium]
MYGLDNVGNIKANGDKLYYLKDHLGTVRVVMDTTNTIVAGYDGACPALLPAGGR